MSWFCTLDLSCEITGKDLLGDSQMYNFGIQNIFLSREDLGTVSINDNWAVEGQGYIGNVMKCHLVLCFCRHSQEVLLRNEVLRKLADMNIRTSQRHATQ